MLRALFVLLMLPITLFAQTDKKPDVWEPLRYFVGSWEGTSKGQFGNGKVEREYRFTLNGTFLEVKNKATYTPQDKNPKGEVHEDIGLISYDKMRKKFVLRQFHVEGFVNQYVLGNLSPDSKTFGFDTESIENIPAGWRARETYKILNSDEFVEIFELAPPGKEFSIYTENTFKRKQR
jgi:hypothetical protein